MIKDKNDERENRDGNNSSYDANSSNNADEPKRRKRVRVGDLRKQNYDSRPSNNNSRNPYSSTPSSRYEPQDRPAYNQRDYRSEDRYVNNDNDRYDYENNRRSGYNNDYNQNRDNRRPGGYSGGGYSDNRNGNSRGNVRNNGGGDRRYPSNNNNNRNRDDRRPMHAPASKKLIKPVKYKENIDPNTPIRLNKYLANAGVCSRREADTFITNGLVKVNGEVIDVLGTKVLRGDVVTFNDQPIRLESKVYVLLNKPKNCVTTAEDPQNRLTVMELVKGACPERIYPVGRLDRNTTGVLLLTNDGDLASKLMHPKYEKKKIYQVMLDRDVAIEDMQAIADGIELDDGEIHADSIAYQAEDILNVVGIEIHSGRNRIVRRIFEKLNYRVLKLDRVYFAGLTKKGMTRGKWRYLTEKEVNMLRMGAFE